jgi:hypothetical protein
MNLGERRWHRAVRDRIALIDHVQQRLRDTDYAAAIDIAFRYCEMLVVTAAVAVVASTVSEDLSRGIMYLLCLAAGAYIAFPLLKWFDTLRLAKEAAKRSPRYPVVAVALFFAAQSLGFSTLAVSVIEATVELNPQKAAANIASWSRHQHETYCVFGAMPFVNESKGCADVFPELAPGAAKPRRP